MRTHVAGKPFKCHSAGCEYATHDKNKLTAHEGTHSTLRPFACATCGSTFKQQSDLQRHQRAHSTERPFVCTVSGCDFASAYNHNLVAHMQRAHSKASPATATAAAAAAVKSDAAAKQVRKA
jgi:hypothetical protein